MHVYWPSVGYLRLKYSFAGVRDSRPLTRLLQNAIDCSLMLKIIVFHLPPRASWPLSLKNGRVLVQHVSWNHRQSPVLPESHSSVQIHPVQPSLHTHPTASNW